MSKICEAHRKAYYPCRPGVSQVGPRWTRSHTNHQVEGHGGSPKQLVNNLHNLFFIMGSSKIEVLETYFFDMVIT